jgi:CRP-like cAMP-binding protein
MRLGVYDRVDCSTGKLLATAGQPARWVYLVIDGAVAVTLRDGRHQYFDRGSLVGDEAVLARQSYPHTAVASCPTRLLVIPATHFEALVAEIPALTATVVKSLSARLIAAETSPGITRRRSNALRASPAS